MSYVWLKALHVAAVLVFVGGLFAQSIAVAAAARGGPDDDFVVLIQAWDRRVTSPALLVVWALGIAAAMQGAWFGAGWLSAKLALVVVLSALHGIQAGALRRYSGGRGGPATTFARGPTWIALLTAGIALLAVAKPF